MTETTTTALTVKDAMNRLHNVRDAQGKGADQRDLAAAVDNLRLAEALENGGDEAVDLLDELAYGHYLRGENDAECETREAMEKLLGWYEPDYFADIRYVLKVEGYDMEPWPKTLRTYHIGPSNSDLLKIISDLINLDSLGFKVQIVSTYGVTGCFEVEVTQPMDYDYARKLLFACSYLSDWTRDHTDACKLLGFDVDNFRADPNKPQNWSPEQLGKCVSPDALKNALEDKPLMQVREDS